MGRAEELFKTIVDGKESAIDALIESRASEELYLDFKQMATKPGEKVLHPSDLKNLEKAVSGFGNSAGGVVVWGVDCRPGSDAADVASKKIPSEDAAHFRSLIEARLSGLTIPTHAGVINEIISAEGRDARCGYVVTLIPAADNMPLQVPGQARYYMRAGSNFTPIIHSVLAAMFGRRPSPIVTLALKVTRANFVSSMNKAFVGFEIVVRNDGSGLAEQPFVTVELKKPDEVEAEIASAGDSRALECHTHGGVASNIARSAVLPPTVSLRMLSVVLDFKTETVRGDLGLSVSAGTSNGPPAHLSFTRSEAFMNDWLRRFRTASGNHSALAECLLGLRALPM
jgi:hypothetical protein